MYRWVTNQVGTEPVDIDLEVSGWLLFLFYYWYILVLCLFAPLILHVFNTFSLWHFTLLHITSFMDTYGLISVQVWITWVVTDVWWKFDVNSTFRNIFTEKNVDVFNTYFTRCISYIIYRLICNGFTGLAHLRSNWAVCGPWTKMSLTSLP